MSVNCYPRRLGKAMVCWIVCLFCVSSYSDERFPYMGTITGDSVNVRAGSSVNHEILCKLNKNVTVAVRGEMKGWFKIVPPPPVRVWVWSQFVRDGIVQRDSLNVRARPELRSTVLCQVGKGDLVRPMEQQGEWLAIAAPVNCYVWVSAKYVEFDSPVKPRIEDKSEKLFRGYEARRKVFDASAAGAVKELGDLIAGYKRVITDDPNSRTATQAMIRVRELEEIRKEMKKAPEEGPMPEERPVAEEKPVVEVKPEARCLATGIVQRLEEPVGGATHQLVGKRLFAKKIMCYLKAPLMDLGVYEGKKVTVSGTLCGRGKDGAPVVEVRNLVLE